MHQPRKEAGPYPPKFEDPVRVYEVRWRDE